MKIVDGSISRDELRSLAQGLFGNMVKAVVDVSRELIALDAELHADLEAELLQSGSDQRDLWGINLYPDEPLERFIEFDSMINVRPSQDNRTRNVEDPRIRSRIALIVSKRIIG
jgi:hypothetical protein